MFAENQGTRRYADRLGRNDLVSQRVLDDSVLMDACFMCERVRADDCFIRRDLRSGNFGQHSARWEKVMEVYSRGDSEAFFTYGQRNDYFFQRRVDGALANAVDGAFDLAHP